MKAVKIAVRISRRAIGIAQLDGDAFLFADARHLRSRRPAAVKGAVSFIQTVASRLNANTVVVDAPRKTDSTTDEIVKALQQLPNLAIEAVSTAELLRAFGLPALESRVELRRVADEIFQDLSIRSQSVRPFVLDASSLALYAETEAALRG
jgi:hypothetical protein